MAADPDVEFAVVHADDDIIVVDKPAGLVVHPGPGHRGSTLVHGLVARFPDLDPASGVIVGEAVGLVHRVRPAAEIIGDMAADAEARLRGAERLVVSG